MKLDQLSLNVPIMPGRYVLHYLDPTGQYWVAVPIDEVFLTNTEDVGPCLVQMCDDQVERLKAERGKV